MYGPLTIDDFPLMHIGASVYRKTESSPLFTCVTPEIAADICFRLNRDGMRAQPERLPYGEDKGEWGNAFKPSPTDPRP